MVDHPFTDKHVSFRLSLSFPTHLLALITQEVLRNRERAYSFCEKFPKINRQTLVMGKSASLPEIFGKFFGKTIFENTSGNLLLYIAQRSRNPSNLTILSALNLANYS